MVAVAVADEPQDPKGPRRPDEERGDRVDLTVGLPGNRYAEPPSTAVVPPPEVVPLPGREDVVARGSQSRPVALEGLEAVGQLDSRRVHSLGQTAACRSQLVHAV